MMESTTKKFQAANVRIPTVKSLADDTTITTKNSELPEMSYVTSNIALDGKVEQLETVFEAKEAASVVSIPPELQRESELVWQTISSCEVEPFALSNFNFMIPYMDIYDEKLSNSKVIRRPPMNSLWAQTGEDDMTYVEENVKERNEKKIQDELKRFATYMSLRQEHMKIPPRGETVSDRVVVSRPSSAAKGRPEPEEEPDIFDPLETIESIVVTEDQVFEDQVEQLGKTKKKLNLLVEYARGHANRKIIGAWDTLSEAFRKSSTYNVKMVPGSLKPVQEKTLPLSKLITLLAGPQIQFKRKEMESLCEKFDIPVEVQTRARRLSALYITKNATTSIPLKHRCDEEIEKIMENSKDYTISKDQLKKSVFPDNPERLQFELEMIEREKVAKQMIEDEENKKKMAYAEVVEQRRLKSMDDWHRASRTLQYARGSLTPPREFVLREVIDYARYVLCAQQAASMTVIDPAIIINLGEDAFGFETAKDDEKPIVNALSLSFHAHDFSGPQTPSQARPMSSSRFKTNLKGVSPELFAEMRMKPPLKLVAEGRVMQLLTDAVALGKGLNGVSFKDVVELIQAFSVTRIQTFFRCHTKRWRFEKARKCWKKAFSATKGRVFAAWSIEARKIGLLKKYCLRKLIAWKFYIKRLKDRQSFFKCCFWPFFVWRRSIMASSTVKQKTKFLCGRLFPTLIMMRIFRAWSIYAKEEAFYSKKSNNFKYDRLHRQLRDSFLWLRYWTRRRKNIRRHWLREGLTMKRRFDDECVKRPFQVWYSWVQQKKRLNASIKANCFKFRKFILPGRDFVCDREIYYVAPEPSIGDVSSSSKQSRGSKSRPSVSPTKPGSKGSKRKKSKAPAQSASVTSVKKFGLRKPLQYDKTKKFTWTMKKILYDIEDSSDEESLPNFFPPNSQLSEMFSRPSSQQDPRPSTETSRPPTSDERRPSATSVNDVFVKVADSSNGRRGSRRGSHTGKILLGGDAAAFAEDKDNSIAGGTPGLLYQIEEPNRLVAQIVLGAFESQRVLMPEYDPVALFYRVRPITLENIRAVQMCLDATEGIALIETAFRFHKWGIRAFKNLQKHALVCRNAKLGLKKKRTEQLRIVFKVLNDNLNRSLSADITTSVTEQLINEARLAKVDKFSRRRELTDAIKHYQEHQVQLERTRIQAFKASLKQGSSAVATVGSGMLDVVDEKDSVFTALSEASGGSRPSSRQDSRLDSRQKSKRLDSAGSFESVGSQPSSRNGKRMKRDVAPQKRSGDNVSITSSVFGSTKGNAAQSEMTDLTEPPKVDFLFWDREDRELQFNNIQRLVAHGKRMFAMTEYCTDILARGEDHILNLQAKKFLALSEVEHLQDENTKESIRKEEEFIAGFKQYAAGILLNSVYKVQSEFQIMIVRSCMRQYFKALRLSMLLKRSSRMCNRKKLVNWIRICRRLNNIDRLTPKYWRTRKMWGVFNRWLKFFERSHMDSTPSVIGRARRGWELRKGFGEYLAKKKVQFTYYHPTSKRIKSPCTDKNGVFQRWKQFVQDQIVYRMLEQFAEHKYKLQLMRKVLYGWKYGTLTHAEQRSKIESNPDCYAIAHLKEDIDQIVKRYMSKVRLSLPRKLKRLNNRYIWCVRRDARKVLSFKTFISQFHARTEERIKQENTMLLSAFETRGSLQYRQSRVLPDMAHLNDGIRFSDPAYEKYNKPFSGLQIPGGYLISRIRVALKGSAGLVGWQLYWDADKSLPIVGLERGVMAGIGVITHDIILKSLDFLLGVEYIYEGNEMAAIRFNTFKTGWSKWFGSKPSLTAVTVQLSVSKLVETDEIPPELEYNITGPDEERDSALPMVYIIGFLGMQNSERATCLGVIFRHAVTQNIFTYYWVNEGKDTQLFLQKPPLHILELQEQQFWDENFAAEDDEDSKNEAGSHSRLGTTDSNKGSSSRPNTGSITLPLIEKAPVTVGRVNTGFGAMGGTPAAPAPVQKKTSAYEDEKETTESEDTFFDICRMRTVELKQLEDRTDTFVRKVWSNVKLRYSSRQESKLVGLTVLKGITTWLYEGLCKKLVPLAQHAEECRQLMRSIRNMTLKKSQGDARLASLTSGLQHMKSVENQQPWYGKSFLGPLDRVQRKTYFENILDYEQSIEKLIIEIRDAVVGVLAASKRIRILTPQMQLSKRIFNNFSLKLMAGRQKYALLERMSLEQMRVQLMGNEAKKNASTEASASVSGAPSDPNLTSMSIEQVCADLEAQRLEEENKNDYSVASASSASKNHRRTLSDEANSLAVHSLDDQVKVKQSYPDGTFGNKLAEGRAVWESKKYVAQALNNNHSIQQLASPKRVHIPAKERKLLTTDVSPSLRYRTELSRIDPMLRKSVDWGGTDISHANYDAMLAAESNSTPALRKIPTINTPLIVPGRRNSNSSIILSKTAEIVARRGRALMQEKSRSMKPIVTVKTAGTTQYVKDLSEEEIQNQRDYEENIHLFLAEQAILAQQREEAASKKEELLKRKAEMKKQKPIEVANKS